MTLYFRVWTIKSHSPGYEIGPIIKSQCVNVPETWKCLSVDTFSQFVNGDIQVVFYLFNLLFILRPSLIFRPKFVEYLNFQLCPLDYRQSM